LIKQHLILQQLIIKYKHPEKEDCIVLSDNVLEKMFAHCQEHFPKEFGGIFTGIETGKIKVIIDIAVPKVFESSTTGFTRHANDLNLYLAQCYAQSGGLIKYLGEWHSHPNGGTHYSNNDAKSISELARNEDSKQAFPILCILSTTVNKSEKFALFQYDNGQLIEFKKHE
jgi:integrative and conjugative element protein (TIGR02256 family)